MIAEPNLARIKGERLGTEERGGLAAILNGARSDGACAGNGSSRPSRRDTEMNPERDKRIYSVFEAALRCDPAGRAALLDALCGDDPELRTEVERLLADDERASRDHFLTDPPPPGQGDPGRPTRAPRLARPGHPHPLPPLPQPHRAGRPDRRDVVCPACGSTFRLERESTASWGLRGDHRRLGRFELIEAVGVGAFGTVYKARDPQLDRVVAIKVPRAGSLASNEDRDRFLREARSVAQLSHAGIVPVHEVGEHEGLPYLVSDFVGGLTLADFLTGRRPAPREAARLVAEVADALQYAHGHGVIHRDIKPSNVMIDDEGRPHLMDFGLAKREAGEVTMTLDGQVLGTPAYMSPEQAKGRGAQGRWPQRHLQPGCAALRTAHRRAAVPGQHADAAAPGAPRRAAAAAEPQRSGPAGPGDDLPEGDGQGAERAVRDGTGSGR